MKSHGCDGEKHIPNILQKDEAQNLKLFSLKNFKNSRIFSMSRIEYFALNSLFFVIITV